MDELKLKVSKRDVLGKRNRFIRRQGLTPVHLFGHSIESLALQGDTLQVQHVVAHAGTTRLINLYIDGEKKPRSVFVREVQKDVLGKRLLHVDFYGVKKGEKLAFEVPLVLVGEAPALKQKGRMLSHGITSLSIECLPEKVPPQIEIDISVLEDLEHAIHVKDLVLDTDITVHADPEQMIAKIAEVFVEKAAEEEEAEGGAEAEAPAAEAEETSSAE